MFYTYATFAVAAILLTACNSKEEKKAPTTNAGNAPVVVDVMLAAYKSINNQIEFTGTVVAAETAEIRTETSGRLTYLNMPDGSFVNAGTLLARINDADLQAQLAKVKVQLDLAQKTEQRLKKLIDINGVNQADYDAALNQVNTLKADIAILEAQLDKTLVKAPFSGRLGLRIIGPGVYVTPATLLGTLQETNRVKLDFNVPETYSHTVSIGKNIQVSLAESGITTAKIVAIEPQININSRNLKVRAILNSGKAQPGGFAKIYINAGGASNGIMVPTAAVIPDAKSKKVVVVKNGVANFTSIETGLRTETGIEVVKGLNLGDSVVVTGVLYVRPNAPVKVRSIKQL
jgi:membrane fusion protein, multidrug efflux system